MVDVYVWGKGHVKKVALTMKMERMRDIDGNKTLHVCIVSHIICKIK